MTPALPPAVLHAHVAAQLLELVPRAGASSRLTAIAVALVRLGHADADMRARAHEIGAHCARLYDCAGALARWQYVEELGVAERAALSYATLLVQIAACEAQWNSILSTGEEVV